jgi:hypothetical protein
MLLLFGEFIRPFDDSRNCHLREQFCADKLVCPIILGFVFNCFAHLPKERQSPPL